MISAEVIQIQRYMLVRWPPCHSSALDCWCSCPQVIAQTLNCWTHLLPTPPRFQMLFRVELRPLVRPLSTRETLPCSNVIFFLIYTFFSFSFGFSQKPSAVGRGDSPTLGMSACSLSNMNANIIFASAVKLHSLFLNRKFINCYITDMQQRPGPSN